MTSEATKKPARRPKKSEVPPEKLCEYCSGKCCRYFALPIDKPTSYDDFDYIRWYLLHDQTSVYVEDGTWILIVHTKCRALDENNRCTEYSTRPLICREYSTAKCEYDDVYLFEQYFETPEQIEEYANAVLGPRPGGSIRSPKPISPEKAPLPLV